MITASESAAKHLRQLLEGRDVPAGAGLRLLVKKGGCAGMEYAMKIDVPGAGDSVFDQGGAARLIVDPESLSLLDHSELDYSDSLSDEGFKVINPNAERSCGCGTSFEPKKS
jgi:iron-sulfur cluster assembly protein